MTCQLVVGNETLDYVLRVSRSAKQHRIRVGVHGVTVTQPAHGSSESSATFLAENLAWVQEQLARVERMGSARRALESKPGQIMIRGVGTPVAVVKVPESRAVPRVTLRDGVLQVVVGSLYTGDIDVTVERFLRRLARVEVLASLSSVALKLGVALGRVEIRGQRTKWGNCSAKGNLSFNWRLAMAPPNVLRYIVVHEAVHLVVPDHSPKFWLTVQSICPETERAKQWLVANGERLMAIRLGDR